MTTDTKLFVTLDPSGGPLRSKDPRPTARRLPTLDGATLGLLSNGKTNGVELLDCVLNEIEKQYEIAGELRFKKGSVSVPPRKEVFAQLVDEATAVITAIGD